MKKDIGVNLGFLQALEYWAHKDNIKKIKNAYRSNVRHVSTN